MKKANFELRIEAKKSKAGNPYVALMVGLGYRDIPITFDKATISELTGIDIGTINQLQVGDVVPVGSITIGEK